VTPGRDIAGLTLAEKATGAFRRFVEREGDVEFRKAG